MNIKYAIGPNGERQAFRKATGPDGQSQWFPYGEPTTPSEPDAAYVGSPDEYRQRAYGEVPQRDVGKGESFLRGAGDALSLGFGDELAAAGVSALTDIPYDKSVDVGRQQQRQASEQNPMTSIAGQVAGGLGTGAAGVGAGMAKTLPRMLGFGTAEGGLYGAGAADEGDRGSGAALGAATGLAMSSLFPSVGAIYNFYKSGRGAAPTAIKGAVLNKTIEASGKTPGQVVATAEKYGPRTNFMNATEEAGGSYARGVSQQTPEAKRIIRNAVDDQIKGAANRVDESINKLITKDGDYWGDFDKLKNTQKTNAAPLYDEAMAVDIMATDDMMKVLDNPAFRQSWKEAQGLAEMEGRKLPNLYDFDEAGNTVFLGKMPKMQELQYMDQVLNNNIRGLKRSAEMGSDYTASNKARVFSKVRQELNDAIGEQNPMYAVAKKTYAGDQAVVDALELGRKSMNKNVHDRIKDIEGMNQSEKDAYLQGILSQFKHSLGQTGEDAIPNLRGMSNENMKKTISALLPGNREGQKKATELFNRLKGESLYKRTGYTAAGGSQTADNLAMGKNASTVADEAYSKLVAPKLSLAKQAYDWIATPNIKEEYWADIAELMVKPGRLDDAMKMAAEAGATKAQVDKIRQLARTRGMLATGAAQAPTQGE